MKKIIISLFLLLFYCSSAHALLINFDSTGSGDDANLKQMDEWNLTAWSESNSDAGEPGDIFTYQDIATGSFTESFTVGVDKGVNSNLVSTDLNYDFDFNNIFIDIDLNGQYISNTNVQFYGGSATMYYDQDGTTGDFDGADVQIASLTLQSALSTSMTGSLLGDNNLGMGLDLSFTFDPGINSDYFGDDEVSLAGKQWLISVVGGSIDQENLWELDQEELPAGNDTFLIEWDLPDLQAEFAAVPEPTTMLLFGIGLLGLAGASRRKLS